MNKANAQSIAIAMCAIFDDSISKRMINGSLTLSRRHYDALITSHIWLISGEGVRARNLAQTLIIVAHSFNIFFAHPLLTINIRGTNKYIEKFK